MDLYIAQNRLAAIVSPYAKRSIGWLDLEVGYSMPFNLYFLSSTPTDEICPYQITRYASAAITMNLQQDGFAAVATQGTWSEIVPTVTAPAITQVHAGTATTGEYDQIVFASQPGSGSYTITMKGGIIQSKGAVSATAKIYPGITSPASVESTFASMIGAPFAIEISNNNMIVDIHASAVPVTAPTVTAVGVSGLQYLYGYSGMLSLSAVSNTLVGAQNMFLIVQLATSLSNATVTISNASPAVVAWTAHGLAAGAPVNFSTTGVLPAPLVPGQTYYVLAAGLLANAFEIGATAGGAAINTTTAGSGTHTGSALGAQYPTLKLPINLVY